MCEGRAKIFVLLKEEECPSLGRWQKKNPKSNVRRLREMSLLENGPFCFGYTHLGWGSTWRSKTPNPVHGASREGIAYTVC